MSFEYIRTQNFRNLADQEIKTDYKNILIVGENGQGKTNFIESVYLSSMGSSFRTKDDKELIKLDTQYCVISSQYKNSPYKKIKIQMENRTKKIFLDDKRIYDRKELLSISPSIIFSHDDFKFITGNNEVKRWFFDQSISLINPIYIDELRKYKKLLSTRNTILKQKDIKIIEDLDIQLANTGLELMKQRISLIDIFSGILGKLFKEVTGIDGITLEYIPSWKKMNVDDIFDSLSRTVYKDLEFGITSSGPHRDKYEYFKNSRIFTEKASTGQKRLLSLLLRVAQAYCFTNITKGEPIFLFDDVLLELDPIKRKLFLELLPPYSQSFLAFLPDEKYITYAKDNSCIYFIKDGIVNN